MQTQKTEGTPQQKLDESKTTPEKKSPSQQDMMRKDLPKKSVANALEDFDGDEA
jgi:hypothetical protein